MLRRLRTTLVDLAAGLRLRSAPEARLERAIAQAQDQHRQLQEQAAELHDERQSAEARVRIIAELRRDLAAKTDAARAGAVRAGEAGDARRASELTAEEASFALQLAAVEREVAQLESEATRVAQASDEATAAIVQQAAVLHEHLDSGHRLLQDEAPPEATP